MRKAIKLLIDQPELFGNPDGSLYTMDDNAVSPSTDASADSPQSPEDARGEDDTDRQPPRLPRPRKLRSQADSPAANDARVTS